MTALSTLFPAAGGSSLTYVSNRMYFQNIATGLNLTGGMAANRDYLQPFVLMGDVTVDEIGWVRANATAANVYVGIYDSSGNLLTDCAVDADTTAGLHAVSTTAVALTEGTLYFLAVNQSAAVVNADTLADADLQIDTLAGLLLFRTGFDTGSGASLPSSFLRQALTGAIYKSRSNAALSDPLTITGFTNAGDSAISIGVIPQ